MLKVNSDALVAQNLGEANGENYVMMQSLFISEIIHIKKENLPLLSEFSREIVWSNSKS